MKIYVEKTIENQLRSRVGPFDSLSQAHEFIERATFEEAKMAADRINARLPWYTDVRYHLVVQE